MDVVATVARLKLQLLANAFRRSVWQALGLAVVLVYAVVFAVFSVTVLGALRLVGPAVAGGVVTVGGSILVLGFLVVPLVLGTDDLLDPRRFSLLGMRPGRLAAALAIAALVSAPSLVIGVIAVAQIGTWSRGPGPTLLAVLAAVLIIATCVLGARVASALAALAFSSRRARDTSAVLGVLLIVLATPVLALLAGVDWSRGGFDGLRAVADVLGWTPFGAAWAAPAAAAVGDGSGALIRLLVALAFVLVLTLAWRILVALVLITPIRVSKPRRYAGLGWFGRVPAGATWVVAARSLTYWARDPRYRVSLVIVPIVPLVMFVPLLIAGVPANDLWLLPVPVASVFLGWLVHNDVSLDNTAIWLHVSAGVRGRADRIGRLLPVLVVATPVVVAASIGCAFLYGDAGLWPALAGVSLCLLLCGLGISSLVSAAFPYPTVRPGENPFQQPQASGATGSVVQGVSFLVVVILSSPVFALGAFALLGPDAPWNWYALGAGVAIGLLVLLIGTAAGARVFARRGPEILDVSLRN